MSEDLIAHDLYFSALARAGRDERGYVFYPLCAADDDASDESVTAIQPGRRQFNNRYVEALVAQHDQFQSAESRNSFASFLLGQLHSGGGIVSATLIRTNHFRELAKKLSGYVRNDEWYAQSVQLIADTVKFEPHLLANQLHLVSELALAIPRRLHKMYDTPNSALFEGASHLADLVLEVPFAEHLRRVFGGENAEINQDQRHVARAVTRLGLSPDLVSALATLDTMLVQAGTEFTFAACLDRARAIYQGALSEVVPVLKSSPPFRGKLANENDCLGYLVSAEILTQTERELFKKLYAFLSAEGSHRLTAEREQARIAKNILVELLWLLLQRVEEQQTEYDMEP